MKPKLYLINGPLGAGKTTLLRELLKQSKYRSARVIENEFASTSIDTHQLHDHQAEVQTIAGVCICCSTGEELTDALLGLALSSEPVIIEATGVANSLKLIEKLVIADIFDRFELCQGIFVLDAAEATRDVKKVITSYKHELVAADTVLLSKTDLISKTEYHIIADALQALNISNIQTMVDGVFDISKLTKTSKMLEYFATFEGDIKNHDSDTNYAVLRLDDLSFSIEAFTQLWDNLKMVYLLKRMKGDIVDTEGVFWHIEATPSQCRISKSNAIQPQIVLIGANARSITKAVLKTELGKHNG